jgi:hypothetical protein
MSNSSILVRTMGSALLAIVAAGCAVTDNATDIGVSSARLNGHGRSNGNAAWVEYHFKYGMSPSFGLQTPTVRVNGPIDETIDHPVFADVTGLGQGTIYYFALCGRDSNDQHNTPDGFYCAGYKTFNTQADIPDDWSFEGQTTSTIQSPWVTEGPDPKSIELQGQARIGSKNVLFNQSVFRWNAIRQTVAVAPNTNYALFAWVRNSGVSWAATTGEIGVRTADNAVVIANQRFGDTTSWMRLRLDFNSGPNSEISVYAGIRGINPLAQPPPDTLNAWLRVDDIVLEWVSDGPGAAQSAVPPVLTVAPPSAFSSAVEQTRNTFTTAGASRGDLWPSCWRADDMLYMANGDGKGFGKGSHDLVVNRVSGSPYNFPPKLWGDRLAYGNQVATKWSGTGFNRKPTGMLCLGNSIYIAVQDLRKTTFNEPLAASISVSHDGGWNWIKTAKAMFTDQEFTTIFFLDFGKGNENAFDDYVYAYGLDGNWAAQQNLYLARVHKTAVQNRSQWMFYDGISPAGAVQWTSTIGDKDPVLQAPFFSGGFVSQGSVVYNPYFNRYLYATWTGNDACCAVHRLYEAPAPWGPWTLLMNTNYPPTWTTTFHGGYATTTPTKWINPDGRVMMLQSNFWDVPNVPDAYEVALRRITLTPAP